MLLQYLAQRPGAATYVEYMFYRHLQITEICGYKIAQTASISAARDPSTWPPVKALIIALVEDSSSGHIDAFLDRFGFGGRGWRRRAATQRFFHAIGKLL